MWILIQNIYDYILLILVLIFYDPPTLPHPSTEDQM